MFGKILKGILLVILGMVLGIAASRGRASSPINP